MKNLIISGLLAFAATTVQAAEQLTIVDVLTQSLSKQSQATALENKGLNWKVGQNSQYSLKMGFIQGSMDMRVREEVPQGFWLDQNVDLGFMGKQKMEALIDKTNGKVIKLIVNGKEQEPPSNEDMEVITMEEDNITVPAGNFDCIYLKIRSNDQESETWVNPQEIPINGMLKNKAPSQLGEVVIELKSFQW